MIRVGIVGCGGIFEMHAVSLKLLNNVRIVAVCDVIECKAQQKAEKYDCHYYIDYHEMIDKEKLDYVHICTPHYLHSIIAKYALLHNTNVVSEKPMAIKVKDAMEVSQIAIENNLNYEVIFQNRYNPGSVLVKEQLENGSLGEIISARIIVTWDRGMDYYQLSDWKGSLEKEGGGVIIDQAIHSLDLIRWLINKEISYVDAHISNRLHPGIEVEDSADGVLFFEDVPVVFCAVNYCTYDYPVEISLHCENGFAYINGDIGHIDYNNGICLSARIQEKDFIDFGEEAKSYWGTSHYRC